jgi:hypothetical protein
MRGLWVISRDAGSSEAWRQLFAHTHRGRAPKNVVKIQVAVGGMAVWAMLACSGPASDLRSSGASGTSSGGTAGAESSGGSASRVDPGPKEMHRLNSNEYNATVQDVLGATLQPATAAWRGGELNGFDNMASVQGIDDLQYDRYFKAAGALAVELMADEAQRARFLACSSEDTECVRASIAAAGLRVFRRPLEQDEVATYLRVYSTAREQGDDGDAAFTLSLQALLSSAEFLYRIELDPVPDSAEPHQLGAYELASRLSYFLWSSAPDDTLLEEARAGKLGQPAELAGIVDRMLQGPKAQRLVANFAGQWLGARQLPSHAAVSSFYRWNARVAQAASQEMLFYFSEFLSHDRSWFDFPTADLNYIDGELALVYGIPTELIGYGTFERVEYTADQRRGFFGLVGFLALSSFDRRTSPSKRGRWIAGNLLCQEPPPPPPNVPKLDPESAPDESQPLAVREKLEEHRRNPGCAACHALFDPYGLALEEYDAIGMYRSQYQDGSPIDPAVTLPAPPGAEEGTSIRGLEGLSEAVATDPRLGRCLAQKLLTYGLGRVVGPSDAAQLDRVEQSWLAPGEVPSVRRLIQLLVASDTFQRRRGGT